MAAVLAVWALILLTATYVQARATASARSSAPTNSPQPSDRPAGGRRGADVAIPRVVPEGRPSSGAPGPATSPAASSQTHVASPPSLRPQAPDPIRPYRGLGAWVDWFDYGHAGNPDPASTVDELASRGVRTLYLQTGLWSESPDILYPEAVNTVLDLAHARGIAVVGWYVPGFVDVDRDLRASLAVLSYTSPTGQHFDGFAPDIEDFTGIQHADQRSVTISVPPHRGCRRRCTATVTVPAPATQVLAQFNAGVVEYSRRLRQAAPAGRALGAIVIDARADQGVAAPWPGFPWQAIAASYDVVLPMAYWTFFKPAGCPPQDAAQYIHDVVTMTEALMGTTKPIHPIGGVSDCVGPLDVTTYVAATKAAGAIGGSLYSLRTTEANPQQAAFWAALAGLNS